MKTSVELAKFNQLAADLSERGARARALLPRTERLIGIGRYVTELEPPVGVFARGEVYSEPDQLDGVIIDFVTIDPSTDRSNVAAGTVYNPYEGLVTATDHTDCDLSIIGLARTVAGISLERREPELPGSSRQVTIEELNFVGEFIAGDRSHPTAMFSFHFVGQPGLPVEGIELTQVIIS